MKKIMFNDRYGLAQAVLDGRKTMTRRIIKLDELGEYNLANALKQDWGEVSIQAFIKNSARYQVGEVVAIAQSYSDIGLDPKVPLMEANGIGGYIRTELSPGWTNKMFVRADLMPHQIRFTDIRVERLRDISDEDCIKEGIEIVSECENLFRVPISHNSGRITYLFGSSPRIVYAALIDRISGKGTWKSNPFTFCYSFELLK